MKKNNKILCILIGLVFILMSVFFLTDYDNKKKTLDSTTKSIKTTYTTRISRTKNGRKTKYIPQYHYKVKNSIYVCKASVSSDLKPLNTPKNIYYSSSNPRDCLIEKSLADNLFYYACIFTGIIAIAAGIFYKEL